jgi:hypothetical protein
VKRLIEFPLEEGGSIVVETDEPAPEGGVVRAAAKPGEVAEQARETFEAALERIKPVAGTLIAKLRGLHDPPDEAVVEFGLKMSGQAGSVVIASVGAEAHYRVTLTWRREEKKEEEKKKGKPSTGRKKS